MTVWELPSWDAACSAEATLQHVKKQGRRKSSTVSEAAQLLTLRDGGGGDDHGDGPGDDDSHGDGLGGGDDHGDGLGDGESVGARDEGSGDYVGCTIDELIAWDGRRGQLLLGTPETIVPSITKDLEQWSNMLKQAMIAAGLDGAILQHKTAKNEMRQMQKRANRGQRQAPCRSATAARRMLKYGDAALNCLTSSPSGRYVIVERKVERGESRVTFRLMAPPTIMLMLGWHEERIASVFRDEYLKQHLPSLVDGLAKSFSIQALLKVYGDIFEARRDLWSDDLQVVDFFSCTASLRNVFDRLCNRNGSFVLAVAAENEPFWLSYLRREQREGRILRTLSSSLVRNASSSCAGSA